MSDPYAVKQCGDLTIRAFPSGRFVVIGHGSERIGPTVHSLKAAEKQVRDYKLNGKQAGLAGSDANAGAVPASEPPELPVGFSIKRRGRWHTVYDAAGQKVGSGKSHEDAVALANQID